MNFNIAISAHFSGHSARRVTAASLPVRTQKRHETGAKEQLAGERALIFTRPLARPQLQVLLTLYAHRDEQPPATVQLVQQWPGHARRGCGDQDDIERCLLGPAGMTVEIACL